MARPIPQADPAGSEQAAASETHGCPLAHDLWTSLTSIGGFAEFLLLQDDLSPENADYVRAILDESRVLAQAVGALLQHAAEIESGGALRPAPFVARQAALRRKPRGSAALALRRAGGASVQ